MNQDRGHQPRVGLVSCDSGLTTTLASIAGRLDATVEVFGSIAGASTKDHLQSFDVLILDLDTVPIFSDEIECLIQGLTTPTAVIVLVGGASRTGVDADALPRCVKYVVRRDGGLLAISRAVESLIAAARASLVTALKRAG